MTIGPPTRLTCPYCCGYKHIQTLLSGNTFGSTLWSDSKRDCPMLPSMPPVQRCPHCRKYYFYEDADPKLMRKESGPNTWIDEMMLELNQKRKKKKKPEPDPEEEAIWKEAKKNGFGELTFKQVDAAYSALYRPELPAERKNELLFMWLFAYNDEFVGRSMFYIPEECPTSIQARHEDVLERLMELNPENTLLVGELCRELGRFDECERRLAPLAEGEGDEAAVARQILEQARAGNDKVFEIVLGEKKHSLFEE